MKNLLAMTLTVLPMIANATPDYRYCKITGLAFGANKDFIGSVAARIVDKQGLTGNPNCQGIWTEAFQIGKRLSAGEPWSQLDAVTWKELQDFESKILDAVIKNMKIDE